MNPYEVLGVAQGASDSDIKQAYRKLAMKHHPDRGGDEEQFKRVSDAYNLIKDADSRQQYEASKNQSPFGNTGFTRGGFHDFSDVFSSFFGQHTQHQPRRNRDVQINYHITLRELLTGIDKDINIQTTSGRTRTVHITIPPGIPNGAKIKFSKCGDDSISNLPAGDLYVTVSEQSDSKFSRSGDTCYTTHTISAKIAMIGGETSVESIDGRQFTIKIKAGTQPGTKLRIPESGFPVYNTSRTGDLIVVLNVLIPTVTDVNTTIDNLK